MAEAFKLAPAEACIEVFGAVFGGGDEGETNIGDADSGEFDFGFFCGFCEALEGLAIAAQIDPLLFDKFFRKPIDDFAIEVVAAQLGIAAGGLDLKDSIAHIQNRDIKGATAEVKDQDFLLLPLF